VIQLIGDGAILTIDKTC